MRKPGLGGGGGDRKIVDPIALGAAAAVRAAGGGVDHHWATITPLLAEVEGDVGDGDGAPVIGVISAGPEEEIAWLEVIEAAVVEIAGLLMDGVGLGFLFDPAQEEGEAIQDSVWARRMG